MVWAYTKKTAFYLLVIAIVIESVFPFYYAILTSFKSGTSLFEVNYWPTMISWDNYTAVFTNGSFPQNLLNSVIIATLTVALALLFAVTAAYALSRVRFRGRSLLLLTILSVSMFPQIAVLAGLFGFLWAAWYIGFDLHGRRKRPFAKAEREIRLLFARDKSRDGWREAMRLLHRAFDTTDSAAVFGASLDTFFSRHSALSPARELVAEFFVASRSEFFGLGEVADDFDATRLLGLARRLKSLEREMA